MLKFSAQETKKTIYNNDAITSSSAIPVPSAVTFNFPPRNLVTYLEKETNLLLELKFTLMEFQPLNVQADPYLHCVTKGRGKFVSGTKRM